MSLRTKAATPEQWSLPTGWTWHITRVIHCLPDDQVDGYRITLFARDTPVIEVLHRDQHLACEIAIDAACEIYPTLFRNSKPRRST